MYPVKSIVISTAVVASNLVPTTMPCIYLLAISWRCNALCDDQWLFWHSLLQYLTSLHLQAFKQWSGDSGVWQKLQTMELTAPPSTKPPTWKTVAPSAAVVVSISCIPNRWRNCATFPYACSSPFAAAFSYNARAALKSFSTPSPYSYNNPRFFCAWMLPLSALNLYQWAAVRRHIATPRPLVNATPKEHCASTYPCL